MKIALLKRTVVFYNILLLQFIVSVSMVRADEIHYAYPKRIIYGALNTLKGVNYDDARVAIEMNFARQNDSVEPRFETALEILPNVFETARRIRERRLHGLSITSLDYIVLRDLVLVEPLFVASGLPDTPLEPFVLLARKGIEIDSFLDMEQDRLLVENNSRWDVGRIWLETALNSVGLPQSDILFNRIDSATKPARVILPVFFGQADACLVSQSAFDTMVELNPQIGEKLHVLLRSPGFLRHLICVVDFLDPKFVKKMRENVANMHTTSDGKQLLTIFRLRRNFPYLSEYLTDTERVLKKIKEINPGYFKDYQMNISYRQR